MSLNIKNPEAHRLAQALARQTGESLTHAVTEALRERLARLREPGKSRASSAAIAAELLVIGRRCAATRRGKAVDHAQLLYDENGVPK